MQKTRSKRSAMLLVITSSCDSGVSKKLVSYTLRCLSWKTSMFIYLISRKVWLRIK